MVTFGDGLKTFLLSLFNLATFSHAAHTHSHSVMHGANVTPWLLFVHHLMLGFECPSLSNVTTPPNNKKTCLAKAKWTATEEAALVTVLSDQNTWKLFKTVSGHSVEMVEAAVRVLEKDLVKVQSSARMRYQQVSCHLSISWVLLTLLAQGKIQAHQGARYQSGLGGMRVCNCNGPDQVWDSFSVCVLLFIVRSLLTSNTCQSHPASSPFKKIGFPLV